MSKLWHAMHLCLSASTTPVASVPTRSHYRHLRREPAPTATGRDTHRPCQSEVRTHKNNYTYERVKDGTTTTNEHYNAIQARRHCPALAGPRVRAPLESHTSTGKPILYSTSHNPSQVLLTRSEAPPLTHSGAPPLPPVTAQASQALYWLVVMESELPKVGSHTVWNQPSLSVLW